MEKIALSGNAVEKKIISLFYKTFLQVPLIVKSPGRINIIGEHTDYNDGYVLPAGIDKWVYVGVQVRNDDKIVMYAEEFGEEYQTRLGSVQPAGYRWATYILGVVDQLLKKGCSMYGFNLIVDGDLPIGAGLSSSAALECAVLFALNELFDLGVSRMEMVQLAQQAEHSFAGVRCGIMDMFASMHSKKGQAMKLDCRSLEYEYVPFHVAGYRLVLFNSNIKHSLANSAYNERRQQCEQGVQWIREKIPAFSSLRDADVSMLERYILPRDKIIFNRCKYVVEENARVLAACNHLRKADMIGLGQKLFSSHMGLTLDYEVSCSELDTLVSLAKNESSVAGARMMGGGFGGCTINLVKEGSLEQVTQRISEAYFAQTGLLCDRYLVSITDGTGLVVNKK